MFFTIRFGSQQILHNKAGVVTHLGSARDSDAIVGWRPSLRSDKIFLAALSGSELRIAGETRPSSVFSYLLEPHDGHFALRHPVTGKFMSAGLNPELQVNRDSASGWETFELRPSDTAPELLRRYADALGASEGAEAMRALAAATPMPAMTDVARAILRLAPYSAFASCVDAIRRLPSYEYLFPPLQEKMVAEIPASGRAFVAHYAWGGGGFDRSGRYSYGSPRILPYPPATLTVGAFCSISENVTVILGNHLTRCASTFPFQAEQNRWPSRFAAAEKLSDDIPQSVVIGNDVWIGRGSTVLPGSTIGDGCIIAAEAVVRGAVPPYSLYGGNPGRVIRPRFDAETIQRLLRLQWWNWPDWKIDQYSDRLLGGIDDFLQAAEASLP